MIEVLQFIFRDFWTWLGTAILLAIIVSSFGGLIRIKIPKITATEKPKE